MSLNASALRQFRLGFCRATNPGLPPARAGSTWGWSWLRRPGTDENTRITFTWHCRQLCREIQAQVHSFLTWVTIRDYNMATRLYRCFSEAVNVRGESMQAAEPCLQEEPLKEVLLTLGFSERQLKDLHNMEGVEWRLVCRVANLSIVFAWVVVEG